MNSTLVRSRSRCCASPSMKGVGGLVPARRGAERRDLKRLSETWNGKAAV
jgi:hypothetical protein